jgi:cytochrome c-type biogenesis protein CcmH
MTMLWPIFMTLTVLVIAVLLYPLLKEPTKETAERIDFDIVVYRSQLAELEEEVQSGLLTDEQAGAARTEIHRRMLAAEDAQMSDLAPRDRVGGKRARLIAIAAIAMILPIGATALYGVLGSPQLPGAPYAWRQRNDPNLMAATSADELASQLQGSPSAAGYRRLANMYFAAGKYDHAAIADHRAIDLGGGDATTWSEFGEAIVMANGGAVVPQAMVAFTNAIEMSPDDERSRFYIGLAEAQIGNLRQAVAIWRDLESGGEPNAAWLPMVREHIAAFSKQGNFDSASVPPAPPSVGALRAALSAMAGAMRQQGGPSASPPSTSPAAPGNDQDTMIRAMVARLAERMKTNSGDGAGWQRLAHAYNVLGDYGKARRAIDNAVRLEPDNVSVQLTLAETEKGLAPPGDETPPDFIATMRTVLKLSAANVQALYYVGMAEQKAGHTGAARGLWTKALGLMSPDDPMTATIRSRIDSVKRSSAGR